MLASTVNANSRSNDAESPSQKLNISNTSSAHTVAFNLRPPSTLKKVRRVRAPQQEMLRTRLGNFTTIFLLLSNSPKMFHCHPQRLSVHNSVGPVIEDVRLHIIWGAASNSEVLFQRRENVLKDRGHQRSAILEPKLLILTIERVKDRRQQIAQEKMEIVLKTPRDGFSLAILIDVFRAPLQKHFSRLRHGPPAKLRIVEVGKLPRFSSRANISTQRNSGTRLRRLGRAPT